MEINIVETKKAFLKFEVPTVTFQGLGIRVGWIIVTWVCARVPCEADSTWGIEAATLISASKSTTNFASTSSTKCLIILSCQCAVASLSLSMKRPVY